MDESKRITIIVKGDFLKIKQRDLLYDSFTQIVVILFAIAGFFKFANVYEIMNFGDYANIYAISTLFIIFGIFEVIRIFSSKASNIFVSITYIFISIVFLIDALYFSYNNRFPTVGNLNLLWQLRGVEDSVEAINPMKFWWILLDVPLIVIYIAFIHRRLYSFIKDKINIKVLNVVLATLFIGILGFGIREICVTDFRLNYLQSEAFCYHFNDIYDVCFESDDDIDYEKYLIPLKVNKDEKYGSLSGKNIIIIQVEALQSFVVDSSYNGQEIMPFLNSLKNNGYYFSNYYYTVGAGNTSDAEFEVNNSVYASSKNSVYTDFYDREYYSLPYILKDNGYQESNVFHGYKKEFWNREEAYKYQGFDRFYSSEDFTTEDIVGMGISNKTFLKETASKMKEMSEPFYSFIITLSSHHPFYIGEDNSNIELEEEHKDSLFGYYLNAANYVDSALESFFKELKKNGLYDNSIFIIYGDHFAIPNYNIENAEFVADFLGHDFSYMDMFNVPCVIHVPGMESGEKIETVASHVDVLPTLLHLLGIENNKSIMMGKDLFTVKDNIICEQMHVGTGSYISDDVFYYQAVSGIEIYNKAFDRKTGEEIRITNDMLKQSIKSKQTIKDANTLIRNNLLIKPN